MQILILGGTKFLGRHVVKAALTRGHDVTLFNRGHTNPQLFPDVEKLRGDRDGGLDALRGRKWDTVIDTSGYVPRVVRQSVNVLKDAAPHYTFVSSISVYASFPQVGMDEDAPVGKLDDETSENVSEHYGKLKALCEKEVEAGFRERALVVRPGLIVGPYDPTDRFTYWVRRFSEGGDILVPQSRKRRIQFIDVRDLAEWMVRMMERQASGVYNVTGPDYDLTMGCFVQALQDTVPGAGRPLWVSEEFLLRQNVREFEELPLWISDKPEWRGFLSINNGRAIQSGLNFRPLDDTVADTLQWDKTRAEDTALCAGMTREQEVELLSLWSARNSDK